MGISPVAMTRLLGRLTAAMGRPMSDAKVEVQAKEYAAAMGGLPEYAVEWAVDRAIRECSRYPKAAELRTMAKQCPQLLNGNHDQSIQARMREWERDPWATVANLDGDRTACTSAPCPVCGSVMRYSHRGAVITHDDQRHREARVSYSNIGRREWLLMGPLPEVESKPKAKGTVAWGTLETERRPQRISEIVPSDPPPDQSWDMMQQQLAEEATA